MKLTDPEFIFQVLEESDSFRSRVAHYLANSQFGEDNTEEVEKQRDELISIIKFFSEIFLKDNNNKKIPMIKFIRSLGKIEWVGEVLNKYGHSGPENKSVPGKTITFSDAKFFYERWVLLILNSSQNEK